MDVVVLSIKVVFIGDVYYLIGTKMWVISGAYCSLVLIMVCIDEHQKGCGIIVFLVDPQFDGYEVGKVEDKMGLCGSNTVVVSFDDCVVFVDCILVGEG